MGIKHWIKDKIECKLNNETKKELDKWHIKVKLDNLHQYLFNNNYIDKKYFHDELYKIEDLIEKL